MWSDTHFHIDEEDDAAAVFAEARAAGVTLMVVQGTSLQDCPRTVQLADPAHGVFIAIGLHPQVAHTFTDMDCFRSWHQTPGCVAVGEIGLDYYYDGAPHDVQKRVFEQFLQLAVELNKPPVIHCRNAFADGFDIVNQILPDSFPFLIHSIGDTVVEARKWLDRGATLSFNGMVSFKRADNIRAMLAITPLERLLLETDSPYLTPVPFRGQRNSPARIPIIGQCIAEQKGLAPDEIASITTENARRFFAIPAP